MTRHDEYIRALEAVEEAARIILNVSEKADSVVDPCPCPHGNLPRYPTHAHWCDECFERLQVAFWDVEYERKRLAENENA
ncbi:hypothetical protein D6833_08240 [Candidatus Parcubacteria bacterium]|nr:MAG: hypothetical protein D6833_08240 [Candidatus Parcubacteria bacterium]